MHRPLATVVALIVLAGGLVLAAPATALPHGCASASSDYSAAVDPAARSMGVKVRTDEPCTFRYTEGDTFSGSGRFTVTCSTGGHFHHEDFQGGEHPPVVNVPIPQPCAVGAVVTLDGYHAFSGGGVVGGGAGSVPEVPQPRREDPGFADRCAPGTAVATVELAAPVDYSGLLTYTGRLRCDGSDLRITSLTITPTGGHPYPSAGSGSCGDCHDELALSGTIPAAFDVYEVEMAFEVSTEGLGTITETRLGRYLVHWAGEVQPLCPGMALGSLPDTSEDGEGYLVVPIPEHCPI